MISRFALIAALLFSSGCWLFVQLCYGQQTYTLKATPKTVAWGYYDAKAAPVLRIKPELGGLYPAKRVIL